MRLNAMVLFLFIVAGLMSACGDDTSSQSPTTCSFDTDCDLGEVCQVQDKVCIVAICDFCTPEQVCYKPTPDAVGSCSAPECTGDADCTDGSCKDGLCTSGGCASNDDCEDGEVCTLAGSCEESDGTCEGDRDCPSGEVCKDDTCVAGCSADEDCEAGFYCDTEDQTCAEGCRDSTECPSMGHVCTAGECACSETSCPEGKICLDTGNCGDPTSCDQIDCGTQVCDPTTLSCVDACTADSCEPNEVCNAQTGQCEVNNCPGEDPNQCAGNAQRPVWDPIRCFCAECLGDTDCDQGAGEVCNAGGSCFACQTACDPATSGTCQGDTPYCIENCCVECVGAADCAQGQLCLDGFCGAPPNCTVDPSVCPAGYTCTNGQCEAPGNPACSSTDPTSCPEGTFCDPTTNTCQGAGGGLGCGFCNPDCTCDNGLTCDGFLCSGCSNNPFDPKPCGAGQFCLDPLAPICFPSG